MDDDERTRGRWRMKRSWEPSNVRKRVRNLVG